MPPPEQMIGVHIARLPISLPCQTPVVPGTPITMRNGDPVPLPERTEWCAVDAFWFLGAIPVCDVHLKLACELLHIDYEELLVEVANHEDNERPADQLLAHWRAQEAVPWEARHRYSQDSINQPTPTEVPHD